MIITFVLLFTFSCSLINREEYTDINNYESYLSLLKNSSDVQSGLFIFPSSVDVENVIEFKYVKEDGFFDGSYIFYLVCNYDDISYKNEIDRIKNIFINYGNLIKTPLYLNDNIYITISDVYGTYEYVIFDDSNNKVAYIFNQLLDFDDISDEYILKNYKVSKDKRDSNRPGYNMYYNYNSNGDSVKFNEM